MHCGAVTNKTSYYNYLSVPVVIVERSGFRFVVHPNVSENVSQQGFIVRVDKTIRSVNIGEIKKELLKVNDSINDELNILRDSLIESNYSNVLDGLNVPIDTVFTMDDFKNNNQCLYCDKRDIIVSLKNIDEASAHPASIDTVDGEELMLVKHNDINTNDLAIRLEIVDNNDYIGDRYTYALGEVRTIKAKKDPNRQSGFYYHSIVKNFLNKSNCVTKLEVLNVDEADTKLGLFKTKIDAQEAGDLKEARKKENLDLQHQIEILRKNTELNKNIHEQKILEHEHEKSIRDKEFDYAKREYEHRNNLLQQELDAKKMVADGNKDTRKDIMDLIKFLPQLIIAMSAIFVVFAKVKTPK